MSFFFLLTIVEWLIRIIMVPVVLRRRFVPTTALAWLSVIFLIPELGLFLYLLIGGHRLGRRRVRLYHHAIERYRRQQISDADGPHETRDPEKDPATRAMVRQAQHIGGMPILSGNDVELLTTNRQFIESVVADIDGAQHHVHMLFYIFEVDEVGEEVAAALARAARRGVECRLLADDVGSWNLLNKSAMADRMADAGVEVSSCLSVNPVRRKLARIDVRNHRKLVIVDGQVGYTGSHNVVHEDYCHKKAGAYVDLSARFRGPIAMQLQAVFLEDWFFEMNQTLEPDGYFPDIEASGGVSCQAVPTIPTDRKDVSPRIQLAALNAAKHKVVITTPYLIPDEATLLALGMAVDRGCEVDMIVPYRCDLPLVNLASYAYYERLMMLGVHLHAYHGGMLHSKTMTIDDDLALLGSSNLDIRSFFLNFEINVAMYGSEITRQLRQVQMDYLSQSTQQDLEMWKRKPYLQRMTHDVAALFSPLL